MISAEEQKDLEKLHAENAKERELFFGMVREIIHADDEMMAAMGLRRKTKAEAVYKYARKRDFHIARLREGCFAEPLTWDARRGRYLTVRDLERRRRDEAISSAMFITALIVLDLTAAVALLSLLWR